MSIPRLVHLAGLVCIVAALLIGASDLISMTIDSSNLAALVMTPAFTACTVLKLAGTILLLLGLVGLYLRQSATAGRLGLAAFLVAFTGTALVAGDWWFETFVLPWQLGTAPGLGSEPATGTLLVGGSATFLLFTLGWILFGVASFRARVFPRWSAILLILGGALAYAVGFPPFGLALAIAVGVLGVLSYRLDQRAPQISRPPATNRAQVVVDLDSL